MLRIFKYELRLRRNTIFILGGIMTALSVSSIIFLLFKGNAIGNLFLRTGTTEGLWYGITIFSIVFIPMVMFFTCSNGHVDELLYKDTNYLMLTIPVRSESILGGRLLAGFTEFLIYSIISVIFGIIFIAWGYTASVSNIRFFSALSTILKNIFVYNPLPLLYSLFAGLSWFLVVGTGFMFVKALTRSFIRKKKLAQFISMILFVFIFSWIIRLGVYLSLRWELVQTVDLMILPVDSAMFGDVKSGSINIHLITNILLLIVSAVFFFATNWLFDKKVEL